MAKDIIHDSVKNALIADGWVITHDPYIIRYGDEKLYADLAAERVISAARNGQKIVVEIKSFAGYSAIQEFKTALGQYMIYLTLLRETAPSYKLYLAISDIAYENEFQEGIIELLTTQHQMPLIIVDIEIEEIVQWIR